jgi:hypothetical protein
MRLHKGKDREKTSLPKDSWAAKPIASANRDIEEGEIIERRGIAMEL